MIKRYIPIFVLFLIFQSAFAQIPPKPKVYKALKISDKEIFLDGHLNEKVWQKVKWTELFQDIRGSEFPIPNHKTTAKILWSDSMIYIGAYLEEPHIWANINEDEQVIYYDNDFEVFIDPNGDHHNYYEFEFNALNKKWDLFLQQPYRDTVNPDIKWNCLRLKHGTAIYGTINQSDDIDSAWTIEIAIPVHQLASELKSGDVWRMNFSRVQWETKIIDNKYIKKDLPEDNWVWSPTWAINMHRPEYWGYVHFAEDEKNAAFILDDDLWKARIQLMQTYEKRRNHWRKHRSYAEWNENNSEEIYLEESGFRYVLRKKVGEEVLKVNEKGRMWKEQKQSIPKLWIWIGGQSVNSFTKWDSIFQDITSLGIRGVLLSASSEKIRQILPLAKKYNLHIHIWMWAMNRGDALKEYLSVNDLGQSLANEKAYVDYYKFMCPALPEVKSFINTKVNELERIDGISGIHLDYIRYVDVFLPKGLLPKYNLVQDDILPEFDYGYHPYMIEKFEKKYGYSPKSIPNYPQDSLWEQFRMDQVSNIVNDLAWQFSSNENKISAAVFPDPEMSRTMVRQDWGNWNLDYYFPMVYNGFYLEGIDWIEERIRISKKYHPQNPIFCGLYLADSKNKEELMESMKAAFRGGASGISFFDYWGLKAHHKAAILEWTKENF